MLGQYKQQKNENADPKKIIARYFRFWHVFLTCGVLSLIFAFAYIRYKTVPQYLISSTILLNDKDDGAGVGGEKALGNLGLIKQSTSIDDQIGIMKSSNLMEKVIKRLSLNIHYKVTGRFKDIEVYAKNVYANIIVEQDSNIQSLPPLIITPKDSLRYEFSQAVAEGKVQTKTYFFGDLIETPTFNFKVIKNNSFTKVNYTPLYISFEDTGNLATTYSSRLNVLSANDNGNLLELSLLDPLPIRGKDILNTLIAVYAEEDVRYKNELAIATIKIIDERLGLLTGEITDVEKDIATYKQDNDLTNISSDAAIYLQNAQESRTKLEEYQIQIDILNSIESYMQNGDDERLVPSSLNIQDPTLSDLIAQFNAKQLEKKGLLRNIPEDNPLIVNINKSLDDLRTDLLENLKNIKNSLQILQNNARQNVNRSRAQIAKVPTAEQALLSINRDQGIKRELYLYLLQKREEEALSLEAPISSIRMINLPKSTSYAVSPNKTSIYIGALVLGFFMPFCFVYVRELINDKIVGIENIRDFTNTPIIGTISHNQENKVLVISEQNNPSVSELFRLLRFNLNYTSGGKSNQVLLITSGKSGEGKTFLTANLAASLALTGKKVVALSFDLRAPKLLQDLKIKEKFGITDYLINPNWTANDIITNSSEISNLDLIGSGPTPLNSGEIMLHPRIEVLFDELKLIYDYIIIDSAPVGKVADAFYLSSFINATLYVLRENFSTKKEVEIIDEIYKHKKLKRPMVVLNDTQVDTDYGYGNSKKIN